MTRTLYYAPGACSLAAHIILEESGLPTRARRSISRRAISVRGSTSPSMTGAAFRHWWRDGWVLTECAAIMRHVARQVPEKGLWPTDLREMATTDEWLGWLACNHHVTYAHIRRVRALHGRRGRLRGHPRQGCRHLGDLCTMTEVRLSMGGGRSARATGSWTPTCSCSGYGDAASAEVRHGRALPGLDRACQARRRPPGGSSGARSGRADPAGLTAGLLRQDSSVRFGLPFRVLRG